MVSVEKSALVTPLNFFGAGPYVCHFPPFGLFQFPRTEDGDMFIVKDPEIFASKVIPQFFKHNNFASFVRQLNFYGFRKIKSDPIKLDAPVDEKESRYWRFRHRNFQRGRLDLLNEMRRKDPNAQAPEQGLEVGDLKSEVDTLKERIDFMSNDIDKLTSLLEKMMTDKNESPLSEQRDSESCQSTGTVVYTEQETAQEVEAGLKKRKVASLLPNLATASEEDFTLEDVLSSTACIPLKVGSIEPAKVTGREESFNSITSVEQEFVNELFSDLEIDDMDDGMKSIPPLDTFDETAMYSGLDPALSRRLNEAVAALPQELHEVFVDRLIETITSPEVYKRHIDAIMASANKAQEIKMQNESKEQLPTRPVPAAASTLRAIQKQYGGPKNFPLVPVHA